MYDLLTIEPVERGLLVRVDSEPVGWLIHEERDGVPVWRAHSKGDVYPLVLGPPAGPVQATASDALADLVDLENREAIR